MNIGRIRFPAMLFCLLVSGVLSAQHHPLTFGLRAGMSIPAGDYASTQLETGSFTTTGLTASAEVSYVVYKGLGFLLQAGINIHPVDVGSLGHARVQDDPFLEDVYIRSEAFQVIHLVGGISYRYAFLNRFVGTGKLLGGLFFAKTPYQLHKPRYFMVGPDYFEITSARDRSWAYGAGLGIAYRMNDCIRLGVEGDLLYSQAAFGFITAEGPRTDWRKISFVNTVLRLELLF